MVSTVMFIFVSDHELDLALKGEEQIFFMNMMNTSINLLNAPLAWCENIARCSILGLVSQNNSSNNIGNNKLEKDQNTYIEMKIEREG